ncbi:hypothetical protein, partial [Xanthomonas sontii]|uniref:hypothetical protein n=1 Tax=Xanthomonas sontii TaxID=2650745 RepID=UPI0027E6FB1F
RQPRIVPDEAQVPSPGQASGLTGARGRSSNVIPGPRSGARNPEPRRVFSWRGAVHSRASEAVLDSGLAFGAPE